MVARPGRAAAHFRPNRRGLRRAVLNSVHRGVPLQRIDFNQPPTAVRPPQIIYDSEDAGRQEAVRMLVTLGTAPPWEGVDTLKQGK